MPINSFNPDLHTTQRPTTQRTPSQRYSEQVQRPTSNRNTEQSAAKQSDVARLAQGNQYFVPETSQSNPLDQTVQQTPPIVTQSTPVSSSAQQQSSSAAQTVPLDQSATQSSKIDNTIESADRLAGGILKYSKMALGRLGVFTLRTLKKGFTMVEDFKETKRFKKSKHMIHTKLYDCNVLPDTGEAQLICYRGKKKTITLPSFAKTKAGTFTITSIAPKFLSFQTMKSVLGNATNSQILDTDIADFKDFTGEIASVELPEHLVYIPSKAFAFAGKITYLHIPSSVTRVSISAFQWSNISYLKFYGPCPIGLRDAKLPSSCIVLYKKAYAEQYEFLGMQGKVMKGR